ncbi:MAG: hypothetical protein J7621_06420 [Niastella sp.]|nr:hypothetical protein [Niastella sp.]
MLLPDGSTAWLDAGPGITYDPGFSGNTREVTLQGEAYEPGILPGQAAQSGQTNQVERLAALREATNTEPVKLGVGG